MDALRTGALPVVTRTGARVSWGALLAGAVATLAGACLLWLLGFGITLVAANHAHLDGATLAAGIIGIGVVLAAAALGGLVAGWLSDTPARTLGGMHGLLGCALAFLVVTTFFARLAGVGAMAVAPTASNNPAVTAPAEPSLLGELVGPLAPTTPDQQVALDRSMHALGAACWIYMAVWSVGLVLAFACGAAATGTRFRTAERAVVAPPPEPAPRPMPPLRPQQV